MTAATLTLTDFILARVAEDEAEVTRLVAHYPHSADEQGWYGNMDDVDVRVGLGRALAECAAKRAVMEAWRSWEAGDDGPFSPDYWIAPVNLIVAELAAVYSDHPDYRDEWRP